MAAEHPDMHISRVKKTEMTADLEGSLKQLRTDCIDLYFYHRDDIRQPAAELIEVMEDFRRQGKIRYYGAQLDDCPDAGSGPLLPAKKDTEVLSQTRRCTISAAGT